MSRALRLGVQKGTVLAIIRVSSQLLPEIILKSTLAWQNIRDGRQSVDVPTRQLGLHN